MIGIPFASLALLISAHAFLRRMTVGAAPAFLLAAASAGMVSLVASMLIANSWLEVAFVSLTFVFGAELYLFLFTFAAASISSNLIAMLSTGPKDIQALQEAYSGTAMADLRIDRALRSGLLTEHDGLLIQTARAKAIDNLYRRMRTFFGHGRKNGKKSQ